jgi:hypothetical protein
VRRLQQGVGGGLPGGAQLGRDRMVLVEGPGLPL